MCVCVCVCVCVIYIYICWHIIEVQGQLYNYLYAMYLVINFANELIL